MHLSVILLAAVFGALSGFLVPRAAYRFAVEPEEPWRAACPAGHAITGVAGGWLGPARCAAPGSGPGTARGSGPGAIPASAPEASGRCPAYGPAVVAAPLICALVCAALAAAAGPRPELVVWLLLTPFAAVLAVVDATVHRLPDILTLPLAGAAVVLLGAASLASGHGGSWAGAVTGALALAGVYFVLFLIHPNGMGFGDVKLALVVGAALGWYGWAVLFIGFFLGISLGAAYGVGLMVLKRAGRKSAMPFGPFMLIGAFLGMLLGAASVSA
ncbi:prepilin peptidase [Streptomyces rectiverticillatus]|uniref:prepilin peptidase n=1 Tax=Streptomyces rectiverticillatus TaxID=173860 RepID=UPI0015C2C6E4|nr:A24 family peptidase [Streptomyces rectiverticillatus]QLE73719.1 prepilin peptidase [Streptomyces rectiverticillatus]